MTDLGWNRDAGTARARREGDIDWREADPYADPEWLIWVKGIGRALRRWWTSWR